ncbi:MAG: thiol:disulfide interchange protein DsbA/DsbL, partial [Pseudomonadota bacterium]
MSGIWRVILCGLCLMVAWPAAAKTFDENQDYTLILPEPDHGRSGDKIEVVEFFMHGCSHCFRFEPKLEAWLETTPADVEFVRVPALFGRHFDLHARAYYALQSLGLAESLHHAWFEEIHVRGNALETRPAIDAFLQTQGVDLVQFDQAMKSFSVQVKLNRAKTLLRRYDIRSVPNIVVDGRYKNAR